MRKISIIVTIALLCSFAVVRRREETDGEAFFQEAITQVMEDHHLVYKVSDQQSVVGNGDHLLWDQPTAASRILTTGFDDVLFVTRGNQLSWLPTASNRSRLPTPLFWELN